MDNYEPEYLCDDCLDTGVERHIEGDELCSTCKGRSHKSYQEPYEDNGGYQGSTEHVTGNGSRW